MSSSSLQGNCKKQIFILGRQCKLTALEQQNGNLSEIEVDEVTSFVRDVGSKVSSNDAMPCGVVFFVKLFLYVCGNVLFREEKRER
jgi:hypothetical protein